MTGSYVPLHVPGLYSRWSWCMCTFCTGTRAEFERSGQAKCDQCRRFSYVSVDRGANGTLDRVLCVFCLQRELF